MALIDCKECGNQISDTAASCPKCGAAVPKTIGPDEEQCPHCMTVVNRSATKCPSCRAVKGYMYDSRYGAFGKTGTIVWGIVVPALLGIAFMNASNGISLVLLLVTFYSAFRVFITGPRWFASRGAD
ncbi:MAG: zinc ribbon domain-containing protein [Candidatus Thiodiazotropha sp.]